MLCLDLGVSTLVGVTGEITSPVLVLGFFETIPGIGACPARMGHFEGSNPPAGKYHVYNRIR
jgi:hypothetical protein